MTLIRGQAWLPEEEAIVLERYEEIGPMGCLPLLPGRSSKAISGRASELGVKYDRYGYLQVEKQHIELSRLVRYWHGPVTPNMGSIVPSLGARCAA